MLRHRPLPKMVSGLKKNRPERTKDIKTGKKKFSLAIVFAYCTRRKISLLQNIANRKTLPCIFRCQRSWEIWSSLTSTKAARAWILFIFIRKRLSFLSIFLYWWSRERMWAAIGSLWLNDSSYNWQARKTEICEKHVMRVLSKFKIKVKPTARRLFAESAQAANVGSFAAATLQRRHILQLDAPGDRPLPRPGAACWVLRAGSCVGCIAFHYYHLSKIHVTRRRESRGSPRDTRPHLVELRLFYGYRPALGHFGVFMIAITLPTTRKETF